MSAPTFSFYDWIKQIPGDVLQLDEIPLVGFPPPFPWVDLASQLSRSLQIENLSLNAGNFQWRTREDLFAGLGDKIRAIRFNVAPLTGILSWVMPEKDIAKLLSILITKNKISPDKIESDFLTSFYQFVTTETLNAFEKIDFDKKLSPIILEETILPSETSLCLDISISLGKETMLGRLFLSSEFRSSWKQRYLARQTDYALKSPMAEKLQIIVNIEGGKTHLKRSEWKKVNLGDVLILDSCSLDVGEDKGRVMLTISGVPFFRAKVKQGSIKILEHPLYHEADTLMNKKFSEEEAPDEDEEDEEYDDESLEEDTEMDEDLDFDDIDEEMDTEIEDETESDEEEEDQSVVEEEEEPKSSKASKQTNERAAAAPSSMEKIAPVTSSSIEDMTMPIILEVGRIQLTVKQLMEMQPGNLLELNVHPENGIDLVANGTRIAKGELLRIGDVLGIRILELS